MTQLKKCKIVMLSTEKASIGSIMKCIKQMPNNEDTKINTLTINKNWKVAENGGNEYWQPQHLYILSDDQIKQDDWCIVKDTRINLEETIHKVTKETLTYINKEDKKIIATTDSSLYSSEEIDGGELMDEWQGDKVTYNTELPQPSKSFIEKFISEYNKGNVITDVMVEYELSNGKIGKAAPIREQDAIYYPKVNPKDNTINIKLVKDSWNKREHIINILKFQTDFDNYRKNCHYGPNKNEEKKWIDEWIEENL